MIPFACQHCYDQREVGKPLWCSANGTVPLYKEMSHAILFMALQRKACVQNGGHWVPISCDPAEWGDDLPALTEELREEGYHPPATVSERDALLWVGWADTAERAGVTPGWEMELSLVNYCDVNKALYLINKLDTALVVSINLGGGVRHLDAAADREAIAREYLDRVRKLADFLPTARQRAVAAQAVLDGVADEAGAGPSSSRKGKGKGTGGKGKGKSKDKIKTEDNDNDNDNDEIKAEPQTQPWLAWPE
ncbi:unnamed protein product [Parajaminaea phylloscopi]